MPESEPTDLDPSTTYDPSPSLTAVDDAMSSLSRSTYGGAYQTADGTIHVGLTSQAPADVTHQLLAQVPGASIVTFPARYTWSDLSDIADRSLPDPQRGRRHASVIDSKLTR